MTDELIEKLFNEINRLAREMTAIRQLNVEMVQMLRSAETEVPESLRRFANYYHDVHDIKYMYEEHGVHPPAHVLREIERLDDRYRQILAKLNQDDEAIGRIRAEMAADPLNRYDHTRQLPKPTLTNGEHK